MGHCRPALVACGGRLPAVGRSDEGGAAVDAVLAASGRRWDALPADPLGASVDREAACTSDGLVLTGKRLISQTDSSQPPVVRLARLDPDLVTWSRLPDSEVVGWNPVAIGDFLVFPVLGDADGGSVHGWDRRYDYGGIYARRTGTWSPLPDAMSRIARRGRGGPDSDGGALVVGDRLFEQGALLDPSTRRVEPAPAIPLEQRFDEGSAAAGDLVLVWGGSTATRNLADGALLRLAR